MVIVKRLMDKQKEEILRSDKLAIEIRQEVYILQREVTTKFYFDLKCF